MLSIRLVDVTLGNLLHFIILVELLKIVFGVLLGVGVGLFKAMFD